MRRNHQISLIYHLSLPIWLIIEHFDFCFRSRLIFSVQLEEPFNILPLRQYSDGVYDTVDFISSTYSDDDHSHQKYKFNFM